MRRSQEVSCPRQRLDEALVMGTARDTIIKWRNERHSPLGVHSLVPVLYVIQLLPTSMMQI